MRSLRFITLTTFVLAPLAAMGCSSSHTSDDDAGGIMVMVDGAVLRPDAGPPGPSCGNGRLEGGEGCDDGNTDDGDGCSSMCRREAYCGNGTVEPPEVCDDGNNRSADGCRSDCGSNELCGNGIVDYATGEVCDGEADCAVDCQSLLSCGDGTVMAPEQCDDSNATRWDGCGADCRDEIVMLMEMLSFAPVARGCDYSGDGNPDNQFARALGPAGALISMLLAGGGGPTILLAYLGLDDPSGVMDDSLRVGWLTGAPGPSGSYLIDEMSLLPGPSPDQPGGPATSIESTIMSRRLDGGPEDLFLPIGFLPLELRQGRVRGTTVASGGELSGLTEGMVCGVVPEALFGGLSASILEMLGGGGGGGFSIDIGPPCDGESDVTFADIFIGGATIVVPLRPTSPDVDLDGDGLETFVVQRTGPDGCQPVVTACIDGDGTRIEGHNCLTDPRIADGYSAALEFQASRVMVSGTTGGATPPPGG